MVFRPGECVVWGQSWTKLITCSNNFSGKFS